MSKTFDKAQSIDWRVSSAEPALQRAIDANRDESMATRLNAAQNEAQREHRVLEGEIYRETNID